MTNEKWHEFATSALADLPGVKVLRIESANDHIFVVIQGVKCGRRMRTPLARNSCRVQAAHELRRTAELLT